MSYQTIDDLPADVRDRLSLEAQELYLAAYNSALDWYGDKSQAREIAWRAVKHQAASLNSSLGQNLKSLLSGNILRSSGKAANAEGKRQVLKASNFSACPTPKNDILERID